MKSESARAILTIFLKMNAIRVTLSDLQPEFNVIYLLQAFSNVIFRTADDMISTDVARSAVRRR